MLKRVRCKMRVNSVTQELGPNNIIESERVVLNAVTSDTPENKEWSKWTPAAQFTITINNPGAFGTLTRDQEFYVDFTPAVKA
jgi:hypothetical protein